MPSPSTPAAFARYLPVEADTRAWGLHVLDCGYTEILSHTPYPPPRHPENYLFTWEQGRTLSEYQLVYITRGQGHFQSRAAGNLPITAGSAFILFVNEWHRYRPDPATGWSEHWIGFDGDYARQLMGRFFSPAAPVLHVGYDEELLALMRRTIELMQSMPAGAQPMMAGYTTAALARLRALSLRKQSTPLRHERQIHQARCHFLEHAAEEVDLHRLAQSLGYSYSRFRTVFKAHTGMAPRQYHLEIRINRARDLLRATDLTVSEIADRLGFSSVYYFSKLFKSRTGLSPRDFRNIH